MAKTGLGGIDSRAVGGTPTARVWLRTKFWSGGLLSLLALTAAVTGVTLLAADMKITPLPYRLRRHLAPIVMPSYDTQLDAELQEGEVVHIGLVVPITVSAARYWLSRPPVPPGTDPCATLFLCPPGARAAIHNTARGRG